MLLAHAAPTPRLEMQINDHFSAMFSTILHLMVPMVVILLLVILLRLGFGGGFSRTTYVDRPSTSAAAKHTPTPTPPSPVPTEVQQLVTQLKQAADKVTRTVDKQNLLTICDTIPKFYKRHQELGGTNKYAATVESKLKSLVGAMPVYLHIQTDPAFYTFESADDDLYLDIAKPEQWLRKASQSIQAYLNLLNAAMRDDSKTEVAQFDIELDNLLSSAPQETATKKPLPPRLTKAATGLYDRAKSQIRK